VRPHVRRALAALLLLSAAGCAPVAPWERGRLAKPQMASEPEPLQRRLRDHVHESREAGAGSGIGRGGGCGCD
jgi:hypothetical protein